MSCPDCELLRTYGFYDRICLACAEKVDRSVQALYESYNKMLDELVMKAIKGTPDIEEDWRTCSHEWEFFIADRHVLEGKEHGVPYHFCKKCKSTLLNGVEYHLKPWRVT